MINTQRLELQVSRTDFHSPKDVWAIEVLLYTEQEGHDCPGLFTWAKINRESDGINSMRDTD